MADDLDLAGLNLDDLASAGANFGGALDPAALSALGLSAADLASLNLGVSAMPDPHTSSLQTLAAGPVVQQASSALVPVVGKGAAGLARIAAAVIRTMGITALPTVAQALGLDAGKMLQSFFKSKGRRRRARGISGRDLKVARRTIRAVSGMYHKLEHAFPRRHAPASRQLPPRRK